MVQPLSAPDAARLRSQDVTHDGLGSTDDASTPLDFSASVALRRRDFDGAVADLLRWRVHERAGLRVAASDVPLVAGTVVLMRLGVGPLALTVPCRVAYVVERPDVSGFAYGTLPGHPESGEERFVVERAEDGSLRFTVSGFSRPATVPARLAGPLGRAGQAWMTRRYLRALDTIDR